MGSEVQDVKQWLESILILEERIYQDEEQLAEIRTRLFSPTSPGYSERVRSSPRKSDAKDRLIDLENEIEGEKTELTERVREATLAIRDIEDFKVEGVMYDKYIRHLTYNQIADKRGYSYDYVRRLVKAGLKKMSENVRF